VGKARLLKGQIRGMLYILQVGLQTQVGCWHNVSRLTVCSDEICPKVTAKAVAVDEFKHGRITFKEFEQEVSH